MNPKYHTNTILRKPSLANTSRGAISPYLAVAFVVLVLAVTIYTALAARADGLPIQWVSYWCGLALLVAAMPWTPALGIGAFAALAYGTPRYDGTFDQLVQLSFPTEIAGLALLGCSVWMIRQGQRPRFHPALLALVVLFVGWIGVCALVAWSHGIPFQPSARHHPSSFLQALALFLVASQTLGNRAEATQFAAIFCTTLIARGIFQGVDGLFLEGDIAPLAVMALPLALLGFLSPRSLFLRAGFLLMSLSLIVIVGLTLNRAGGAALGIVLLLLWSQTRYRWRILVAFSPVLAATAIWFIRAGYWDRFRAIWSNENLRSQIDRATITERLELWRGALRIVRDHPFFGVGPSNYKDHVAQYLSPALDGMAAHNSWLHVASETGLPGLLLYTALFLSGLIVLQQVKVRRYGITWPDVGARLVQASLVAYLVAALFITRHDMVLAYLLLGWASGLWIASRSAGPLGSQPPFSEPEGDFGQGTQWPRLRRLTLRPNRLSGFSAKTDPMSSP